MFVFPHGIHVDRDGNIWVTDGNDNLPRRRAAAQIAAAATPEKVDGHQVFKFSPEGKLLMTLGKAGRQPARRPDASSIEPNDVITMPNGDILVAEGHGGRMPTRPPARLRVSRGSRRTGKFIKSFGKTGIGPGGVRHAAQPGLRFARRLFVADRGNVRLQIFDQNVKFLEEWNSSAV